MKTHRELRGLIAVLMFAAVLRAEDPSAFVRIQKGDLPIILSAPHGGNLDVPNVAARKGEGLAKGPAGFVVARDAGTEELVLAVAQAIEKRFGKKPHFIVAQAHRKYLDPNRPALIAYEDADAKPVYDAYHGALREACDAARKQFGHGLLLDIHGQGSVPDTVFRGTQNGKTVAGLRMRASEAAHTGAGSLFGALHARGWKVHPQPFDGREQAGFLGGYIVQTYGSHQTNGVDAVQLEFGAEFRTKDAREKTAAVLADALAQYATNFLALKIPPAKLAALPPKTSLPAERDVVRVALFKGPGASGRSSPSLIKLLSGQPRFQLSEVSVQDILTGKLKDAHVLIHPGGSGGGQGEALGEEGRKRVREFVRAGGGFVGVCAGAYLATCDYDWSLHILDAKVVDRAHWDRGFGMVDISLSPHGRELLGVERAKLSIYYHQGPLLAPAQHPDIADYEPLAKFETEIAKNGAPAGVMLGCTAVASGVFGKGRVLGISPHLELTEGQETLLLRAIEWASQVKR